MLDRSGVAAPTSLRHASVPAHGINANKKNPLQLCGSQRIVPVKESLELLGLKAPKVSMYASSRLDGGKEAGPQWDVEQQVVLLPLFR